MINELITLLSLDEFYGVSKDVDTAKGMNKIPLSFKEAWDQHKRKRAWRQM